MIDGAKADALTTGARRSYKTGAKRRPRRRNGASNATSAESK